MRRDGLVKRGMAADPVHMDPDQGHPPTEDAAELGYLSVADALLSHAVRWIGDDGEYVVRSTEFDVYGDGDSWDEAYIDFFDHARALFAMYASLEERDMTEHESELALVLGQRIVNCLDARQDELEMELANMRKRSAFFRMFLRRPSQERSDLWHPSNQRTSSQLSHA